MAYEYHIAPHLLLNESERMLFTMQRYLSWRAHEAKKGQ